MHTHSVPKKSALKWAAMAVFCWLIIVLSIVITNQFLNPLTFVLCLIIVMSRHHALLILGHDAAHYLVCENKKLNDLLAYIFVAPTAFALQRYRQFHFLHHRHLHTKDDPELKIYDFINPSDYQLPKSIPSLLKIASKDLIGFNIIYTFKIFQLFRPAGAKDFVSIYGSLLLIILLIAYFKMYWVYGLLLIGYLGIFPFMFRFRTWTEHWGSDSTHIIKAGWLERFFLYPCNTWFHKEHHQYPNIPFWYLPKIRTPEDEKRAITTVTLLKNLGRA